MTWQRTLNEALVRYTGYQLTRSEKPDPEVRPPADPRADRLLVAPVFILCPVRSGSTLLRALLNAHPALHELHVRSGKPYIVDKRARKELSGHTVRYEDLTDDPERETRAICAFLGLDWDPGMLDYGTLDVVRKGLGDWTDKIRSGRVQQPRERPEIIPDAVKPMCRSWGYPT